MTPRGTDEELVPRCYLRLSLTDVQHIKTEDARFGRQQQFVKSAGREPLLANQDDPGERCEVRNTVLEEAIRCVLAEDNIDPESLSGSPDLICDISVLTQYELVIAKASIA